MAASDNVPILLKNRLHLAGRPQMSTRPKLILVREARDLSCAFHDLHSDPCMPFESKRTGRATEGYPRRLTTLAMRAFCGRAIGVG